VSDGGVTVILGGTRGIGAAVASRLAGRDQTLVLNHLQDRTSAANLAVELRDRGSDVKIIEGNVTEPGTRQAIIAAVDEAGGKCHRLVHSVAVTSFKPLADTRANQWDLVMAVSARSLLDYARALIEPLTRARGSVVAISSQGAVRHVPDYGALGPAKAALEATVRQLAVELAPRGIRVNAVRAGMVQGDVTGHFPPEVVESVVQRTPLSRLGTAAEIAAVAVFLLEGEASWLTGQVVEVDGGFAAV
jgi:NAD(P)-dependent dehydrogenase (short-subunit alcohol dehydrogenase family)